jgi:HD-GYP domain-containing protein (c-di-GMP phosphodiesterase class II)
MVRMSDLARAGAAAPPLPRPATAPPASTARPPVAPADAPSPAPSAPRRPSLFDPPRVEAAVSPASTEPARTTHAPESTEGIFEDLLNFLARVPDLLETDQPPSWSALRQVVERVVRSLEAGGDLFWFANSASLPNGADYVGFHLARVTVLAVRIGMTVGFEHERLVELGAAAALSGIGLWQLPHGFLRRLDAAPAEEQSRYHAHPRLAAERLRLWTPPFEALVQTVLQHQEREQGQGFPQGLAGPAIRMEAKIVGLADTYMTLTAPPSLRPGLRPYEAVREIVRSKHGAFPSVLVKALLSEVTVFPPGTMVRLNSGEIGSVIAVNRNHPLRPRIQVVGGKAGDLPTPKTVDLSEAPFLYITGPLTETAR